MDVIDRLNICFFIEKTAAQIYRTMAGKFPDRGDLFEKLSKDEEHHANVIALCMGYYKTTPPTDIVPPPSATELSETLVLELSLREMLRSDKTDMRTAIEKAYEMEGSLAEDYFNLIRSTTTDRDVVAYLQECYKDEEFHAEQLSALLAQLNAV